MRVLLQRVSEARVVIEGDVVGEIGPGYVLLVGVGEGDDDDPVRRLATKIVKLRLFPDDAGKFDRSLLDIGGGALVVSQFTLYGEASKGNRPSFTAAARPEHAEPLCDAFADALRSLGVDPVATGRFAADMQVTLTNDGPVTLWLDSDAMGPHPSRPPAS